MLLMNYLSMPSFKPSLCCYILQLSALCLKTDKLSNLSDGKIASGMNQTQDPSDHTIFWFDVPSENLNKV